MSTHSPWSCLRYVDEWARLVPSTMNSTMKVCVCVRACELGSREMALIMAEIFNGNSVTVHAMFLRTETTFYTIIQGLGFYTIM